MKNKTRLRLVLFSLIIFVAESIIMIVLSHFPFMGQPYESIFDAIVLTLIATPTLYFFLYLPMLKDRAELHRVEKVYLDNLSYDSLTGLPLKHIFHERLKYQCLVSRRNNKTFAMLSFKVFHLNEINNTFGYETGNQVISIISKRLQAGLRESDTITREHGNEFRILMPDVSSEFAYIVSRKIEYILEQDIEINGVRMHIEIQGGIVIFPMHGEDTSTLINRVDISRRQTILGCGKFSIYQQGECDDVIRKYTMFSALKSAIDKDGELRLFYQPKLLLSTNRVTCVEALARWDDKKMGNISPAEFVPIAEKTGIIHSFTWRVIQLALDDMHQWKSEGFELRVSINVPVKSLQENTFACKLCDMVKERGLEARYVDIEITESTFMDDVGKTLEMLFALRDVGFSISIDDFGTGYSSLFCLSKIPAKTIKIDQGFVKNIFDSPVDRNIVLAAIGLAKQMNLDVVAEGVEDEKTCHFLKEKGCDYAQGYYIEKAIAADKLSSWVEQYNATSAKIYKL